MKTLLFILGGMLVGLVGLGFVIVGIFYDRWKEKYPGLIK